MDEFADLPGHFRVRVPDDCALFEGHFPGVPVLPGVAQLGIVLQALGNPAPSEIVHFRLRHQVRPGDALELVIRKPDADTGEIAFDLTREGERVAHGLLRLA